MDPPDVSCIKYDDSTAVSTPDLALFAYEQYEKWDELLNEGINCITANSEAEEISIGTNGILDAITEQ